MEQKIITVRDIMTEKCISVHPDTGLLEAARLLFENKFDGLPVVDSQNVLVGILTEYDLISKGSLVHLPTLQFLLSNLPAFKKDRSQFEKEIHEVSSLTVQDVMNTDPLTLPESATFNDTVAAFRDHHRVNPIPVIDDSHTVVGVVSRFDILKPFHFI